MWYLPSSASYYMKTKHIKNSDGNWEVLLQDTLKYLNTYIAPHHLISVSIMEEDHPNQNRILNAIITHKGEDSYPLSKPEDIQGDIYRHRFYNNQKSWDDIVQKACMDMERQGVDENKFAIASANMTHHNTQALAIISWSKVHEDLLADLSRGGCSCNIF